MLKPLLDYTVVPQSSALPIPLLSVSSLKICQNSIISDSIAILCFISQVINGNLDYQSVVSKKLKESITACYIRFKPLRWSSYRVGMRAEIYGCLGIAQISFYLGYVVGNRSFLWEGVTLNTFEA